jgi:serine/threonine protein kinase/predicted negative regulator of RcsB-dependent stress response
MDRAVDENLLFAALALQTNFIDRGELVRALETWLRKQTESIADILRSHGKLTSEVVEALNSVLKQHLLQHGDQPSRSLSSLASSVIVREEWQRLTGGGLSATVSFPQTDRHRGPAIPDLARSAARYRILRPHAHGGLGEVSLAHDNELNREVALKEIKEVYADDPAARDRFLREAQITGQLEHPGIVPVYGLETNPQGRPCYAMRFINGDTLKSAITAFHREPLRGRLTGGRLLEFRQLLGRFIAVCQAVHFAHSRGVLHRDIKPTNVMVGRFGETLVVDWGLAKVMGAVPGTGDEPARPTIEGDHHPTLAGTAIGTPAYMSPEQAAGNIDLGAPSDVYSLGATLYHLLTNRAPIGAELSSSAADELSVTEVLRRATAAEFPRPSAVTGSISPALEAVCLKAMAHKPEDRYRSAAELAEDLERWLADEPVSAWREPVALRAQRWVRKRQTAVISTVATLAVGLIAVAVLLGVSSRANQRLKVANHDLSEAVLLAQEHNKLALDTLNYVIVEVQRRLDGVPGTTELRHGLLDEVVEKLKHVSNKYQSQGAIDHGSFMALCDLGDLLLNLGSSEKRADGELKNGSSVMMAASTYDRALSIAKELAAQHPDEVQARRDLANAWQRQGDVCLRIGKTSDAVGHYEQSLTIRRKLVEDNPKFAEPLMELWTTLLHLGDASLQGGQMESAQRHLDEALAITERLEKLKLPAALMRREKSMTLERLGDLALRSGKQDEARERYQDALEISRALASAQPLKLDLQRDVGISCERVGDAWMGQGRTDQAQPLYSEALTVARKNVLRDPRDMRLQRDLSAYLSKAAAADFAMGRVSEAKAQFEEAAEIGRKRLAADPLDFQSQADLAVFESKLGDIEARLGHLHEASERYQAGLTILDRQFEQDPANSSISNGQAVLLTSLGLIALAADDDVAADGYFNKALTIRQQRASQEPGNSLRQAELSNAWLHRGDAALAAGKLAEARQFHEKALRIHREQLALAGDSPPSRQQLAVCLLKLGDVEFRHKEFDSAKRYYEETRKLFESIAAANPADPSGQRLVAVAWSKLGDNALQAGSIAEAVDCFKKTMTISEALAGKNKDDPLLLTDLVIGYSRLTSVAALEFAYEDSIAWAGKGLATCDVIDQRGLLKDDPRLVTWKRDLAQRLENSQLRSRAVADIRFIREQAVERQPELLVIRGKALLYKLEKDHRRGQTVNDDALTTIIETAAELGRHTGAAPRQKIEAARAYARSATLISKTDSSSERKERRSQCLEAAARLLKDVKGENAQDVLLLKDDPAFKVMSEDSQYADVFMPAATE